MWRKRDYKLIFCMDKSRIEDGFGQGDFVRGELYDLNRDPQEWDNVFNDEEYTAVRQKMSGELIKHLEMYVIQRRVNKAGSPQPRLKAET